MTNKTQIFFKDFRDWCNKHSFKQASHKSLLVYRELISKTQEEICRLCSDTFYFGANVNTNALNLCEGSHCCDMEEILIEDIENDLKTTS